MHGQRQRFQSPANTPLHHSSKSPDQRNARHDKGNRYGNKRAGLHLCKLKLTRCFFGKRRLRNTQDHTKCKHCRS